MVLAEQMLAAFEAAGYKTYAREPHDFSVMIPDEPTRIGFYFNYEGTELKEARVVLM
jgi:hypothetical protein